MSNQPNIFEKGGPFVDWIREPNTVEPDDICFIKLCEIRECEKHVGSCAVRMCLMVWCFWDDGFDLPT